MTAPLPHGTRWWREETNPHNAVHAAVDRIKSRQSARETLLLFAVSLYGDYPIMGVQSAYHLVKTPASQRLSYNVIASVCDSMQAEVIQSRPRPMFLTSEGNWEEKERAKQLSKYCEGLFYEAKVDQTAPRCALDALVTGTGIVKVYEEFNRVCIERVLPWEIHVDDRDGYDGFPRTMYQTKWVDRDVLLELYPDEEQVILGASSPSDSWGWRDSESDQLMLVEAWHMPSGPEADDGRHVIAIEGATLFDEAWPEPAFPFAVLRWKQPLMGYWGTGVAEALAGLQNEINRLARDMQIQQYFHSNPKIAIPRGARVLKNQWTNDPAGAMIEYDGPQPPQVLVFPAVSGDTREQLDRHYQRAYELIGVSQMAAQSVKPAGINSGVALRTYLDNQSKRFILFARAYEQFHVDISTLAIRAMRRLADSDESYEVVYRDGSHIERIDWRNVDMDEETYVLHVFPVSALANTPAGRLQQLQELFGAGLIDRDMFLELSNMPDFEAQKNLLTAPRELIEKRVYAMLRDGTYYPPNPMMNLALCIQITGLAYQRAELEGVPEDRLALLRQFLSDTQALMAPPPSPFPGAGPPPGAEGEGMAPPMPPGPGAGPPPGAPPGPPPPPG